MRTEDERWETLCIAALAVERSPYSQTAADVLLREARRLGAPSRGLNPFAGLRGMSLAWQRMSQPARSSNAAALGTLARRCAAVLKGEPDPHPHRVRPRADLDG